MLQYAQMQTLAFEWYVKNRGECQRSHQGNIYPRQQAWLGINALTKIDAMHSLTVGVNWTALSLVLVVEHSEGIVTGQWPVTMY